MHLIDKDMSLFCGAGRSSLLPQSGCSPEASLGFTSLMPKPLSPFILPCTVQRIMIQSPDLNLSQLPCMARPQANHLEPVWKFPSLFYFWGGRLQKSLASRMSRDKCILSCMPMSYCQDLGREEITHQSTHTLVGSSTARSFVSEDRERGHGNALNDHGTKQSAFLKSKYH